MGRVEQVLIMSGSPFWLFLFFVYSQAFTPLLRNALRISTGPTMMTKAETQLVWSPTVPNVVDLSKGALVTDYGVEKSAYEAFFSKIESSSYCGYKWELVDNRVFIYDMVDMPHEKAAGAFDGVMVEEALLGGWRDQLHSGGSGQLKNPDPKDSNWQPDCSYFPDQRQGPMGSNDESTPYPTMVLEVATSEDDDHVIAKAHKYLTQNTTIQIVLVLLIRPKKNGPDRLKVLQFERGRQNPCWQCSFADPLCTRAGSPSFILQLPVNLMFDNAPIPVALAGKLNLELDLFLWKKKLSWP
jgi:hypothetical protein